MITIPQINLDYVIETLENWIIKQKIDWEQAEVRLFSVIEKDLAELICKECDSATTRDEIKEAIQKAIDKYNRVGYEYEDYDDCDPFDRFEKSDYETGQFFDR